MTGAREEALSSTGGEVGRVFFSVGFPSKKHLGFVILSQIKFVCLISGK